MPKTKYLSIIIIFLFIVSGCKSKKHTTITTSEKEDVFTEKSVQIIDSLPEYKVVAIKKLGEGVQFIMNETKEFVLCNNNLKPLELFIYSLPENQIIFEDTIFNGKFKWIRPYVLQVNVIPENALPTYNIEKSGYHFMVKEKKLVPIQ